jgi:hypothetical protein
MDEIDLDVDNYDIDELIQILNFDYTPTNEDMIVQRIDILKRKYKDKSKYIKFFKAVGKKLIDNFELFNKETWQENYKQDDSLSAKVLTQQYLDNKNDTKNLILDEKRNIIGIKRVPASKTFSTKLATQGTRNPVTINYIRRIVNFDSQYREILNPISTTCTVNGNYTNNSTNINNINHVNPEIRLFQPTNYTVNLNQPLTNVIDISLESVELPNSWHVFSNDYGTNALNFSSFRKREPEKLADIYLPTIPTGYTLSFETIRSPYYPRVRDTEMGITKVVNADGTADKTKTWLKYDDDGGYFLFSKLSFNSTECLTMENNIYQIWIGQYNTVFTNGSDPTVNYKYEAGRNWRFRVKIIDSVGVSLPGFTTLYFDSNLPNEAVGIAKTFIINSQPISSTPPIEEAYKLELDNGNFTSTELLNEINSLCSLNDIPVDFTYSSKTGKVSIENLNRHYPVTIQFYIEDAESSGCSAQKTLNEEGSNTPSPGNKIGYNLGWLLGFRVKTLILTASQKVTASSLLDTFGPKYFILTLDDFNNNKPNKDLISLVDNSSKNFKLPDYYNSQTMNSKFGVKRDSSGNIIGNTYYPGHSSTDADAADWKCQDVSGIPAERGCAENELNNDLISNLTKKQQYTVEQLTLANTSSGSVILDDGTKLSTVVNRYSSPNSSDLLARIPITIDRQQYSTSIVFRNTHPEYTKRVYFGPVKLRKFKIRLLNDKGFEVNLNDQDWSFSIYVTQLYQF